MPEVPRTLVLGAGASGLAAARLLKAQGAWVTVADGAVVPTAVDAQLAALNISLSRGNRLPGGAFDQCIVSPGIPLTHPWIRVLSAAGVTLRSELALGAAHWRGGVIAVTATKGKSSVVKLCRDALESVGLRAAACGNYGLPLSALALDAPDLDWAVVEVSSFQLEWPVDWRPRVAVLLNVMPDHLERHGTLKQYRAMKLRLFAGLRSDATALLPEGFRFAGASARSCRAARRRFGVGPRAHWRYGGGRIEGPARTGERVSIDCLGSWFDNALLGPAAAAAAAALTDCGLMPEAIGAALRGFQPLPHRLQELGECRGIRFVNDSKATCLRAAAAAVELMPGKVRLIAGGLLKEPDLGSVKEKLAFRVEKAYLIGRGAKALSAAWQPSLNCRICGDLATAFRDAWHDATPGETILLSPGCASFDQFVNYSHRGEVFTELVRELQASTREPSANVVAEVNGAPASGGESR